MIDYFAEYACLCRMSKVNGRLIAANEQSLSFLFFCLHKLEIISCSNQVRSFGEDVLSFLFCFQIQCETNIEKSCHPLTGL